MKIITELRPIVSSLLRNKAGALLIAMQIAVSLAILSNALHTIVLRQSIATRASGIADESTVFYLRVQALNSAPFAARIATQKRQAELLRMIPGVLSVAETTQMAMSGYNGLFVVRTDRDNGKRPENVFILSRYESPDSLIQTWQLKLVEGRDFNQTDVVDIDQNQWDTYGQTVIITKKLAREMFPGSKSVVGKTIYMGGGDTAPSSRIIGVVECLQGYAAAVDFSSNFSLITPTRATGNHGKFFTVRTSPEQRDRAIKAAEALFAKSFPDVLVMDVRTVEENRIERYRNDNTLAWMLVAISVLMLLITASGIIGMTTLWVNQRQKQIGVRRALGARKADILRYFISENFIISTLGIALGIVLAIATNQVLVSRLEMQKLPLEYLFIGAGVLWLLGLIAVYAPASRAAGISPAIATRTA